MINLKEIIIKKKELEENFEKLKKENHTCVKNIYLKEKELYCIRKKYYEVLDKKNKLKNKKKKIILILILSLLLILISLILPLIFSNAIINVIDMFLFKFIMDIIALVESLLSILFICNSISKYHAQKENINNTLFEVKNKISNIQNELKNLDSSHQNYCNLLNKKEAEKNKVNKIIDNTLYKKNNIIYNSEKILESNKNLERIRMK